MLFSEGCYLDTFFSGLSFDAPYFVEVADIQGFILHTTVSRPGPMSRFSAGISFDLAEIC